MWLCPFLAGVCTPKFVQMTKIPLGANAGPSGMCHVLILLTHSNPLMGRGQELVESGAAASSAKMGIHYCVFLSSLPHPKIFP